MKSRVNLAPYRKQINEAVQEVLKAQQYEISLRCGYALLLALDDHYRNRFGKKDETIERHYQQIIHDVFQIIGDYKVFCYEWESGDENAMSRALLQELEDRGIHIELV